MSIRPLVQLDKAGLSRKGHLLRTASEAVVDFGSEFQAMVDDLVETFASHSIAVGLAAPQIGVQLRVAIVNIAKDKSGEHLIIVNPTVVEASGKKDRKKESCMSLPHYAGEVERRRRIELVYQDRGGVEKHLTADGFLARVIAHEVDHLDGMLYVDRMAKGDGLVATDIFRTD